MLKNDDIHLRDPFVLAHNGKYYLYGSRGSEAWSDSAEGLDVYVSEDLENWSEPVTVFKRTPDFWATMHYWAPEVYFYKDAFYMFASFKAKDVCRGTMVLRSEAPDGKFTPWSDGCVTPKDWECLDGTLVIEDGEPYMVFSHEWVQVRDGEFWAVKLSEDLKRADGEPFMLFKASEAPWAVPGGEDGDVYVTDGPFLYRTRSGKLLMLWSGTGRDGYTEAIAVSDSGRLGGKWTQREELLFKTDGGHGMIFKTFSGELMLALHAPNESPLERPVFFPLKEENDMLKAVHNK